MEQGWDQQVFNEETFFLSHGDVKRANVDGTTALCTWTECPREGSCTLEP